MITIRVIDDVPADIFVLQLQIKRLKLDWRLLTHTDPVSALAELKRTQADSQEIVLVDITMPGLDGFAFVDEYMKLPKKSRLNRTVCIASGSENPADHARALSMDGVAAYLAKPIDPEAIYPLLKAA